MNYNYFVDFMSLNKTGELVDVQILSLMKSETQSMLVLLMIWMNHHVYDDNLGQSPLMEVYERKSRITQRGP